MISFGNFIMHLVAPVRVFVAKIFFRVDQGEGRKNGQIAVTNRRLTHRKNDSSLSNKHIQNYLHITVFVLFCGSGQK